MFVFCLALLSLFLVACITDGGESEYCLIPDSGLPFSIFPNDESKNDSASLIMAHGLAMNVHAKAMYELSFDADEKFPKAPTMHLFKIFVNENSMTYKAVKIKKISPRKVDGRYIYEFVCDEKNSALWAFTLEQNHDYYKGTTNNVKFKGIGAYSDHLSLNLILTGNVASQIKGFTVDELAADMLAAYRKYYSSVVIDTLYVNYSSQHPTLGRKYPANEPWLAGFSSKDMMVSELGGWPGIENALDIVLTHYINVDNVMGYSNLFSGNMLGGDGSTVVLGAFVKQGNTQIRLSKDNIIETAVHETGHFFGLRHTTATRTDLYSGGDLSNVEDGFEDTPFCAGLSSNPLYKSKFAAVTDIWKFPRIKLSRADDGFSDVEKCPDVANYMFPVSTNVKYVGFSEQQLATLRASLMIFPH